MISGMDTSLILLNTTYKSHYWRLKLAYIIIIKIHIPFFHSALFFYYAVKFLSEKQVFELMLQSGRTDPSISGGFKRTTSKPRSSSSDHTGTLLLLSVTVTVDVPMNGEVCTV